MFARVLPVVVCALLLTACAGPSITGAPLARGGAHQQQVRQHRDTQRTDHQPPAQQVTGEKATDNHRRSPCSRKRGIASSSASSASEGT